jgi:cytochrome c oxidase subunit 2
MNAFVVMLLAMQSGVSQSALEPGGLQAHRILGLGHIYFWVSFGVYLAVIAALVAAVGRRGAAANPSIVVRPSEATEHRLVRNVSFSVAGTALILLVLLAADFHTGREIHSLADKGSLSIRVTGSRWWWAVEYQNPDPSLMVTTANEIHIPVGRTVHFQLEATDVIHSFWVPGLHGKTDMIPGHITHTWLRADEAGSYGGQCAEFCGAEHAKMRFVVVAQPESEFRAWLEGQRKPAAEPDDAARIRGRAVFLESTCILCHTIRGTTASGFVGPDLTHVGSRSMIGAGSLQNLRGHLAGWIVDPQRIKPGILMPMNPLPPADLEALVDYLEKLT